jgi:prepilin-type N-terminal cleavage/methylation domain-containing protein
MPTRGFTLVEMAMVVLIIGLVMLTVFPALTSLRAAAQRGATDQNLQTVMRAVAIYAQNNGCLPCPTPASTTGNGFGQVRGDTAADRCGSCVNPEGIPPFAALGIPANLAKDGWGRWLTMRIDPNLAVNCADKSLSNYALYCATDITLKGLCASGVNKTARVLVQQPNSTIRQSAAVVLVSHGANGYGAFVAKASTIGASGRPSVAANLVAACTDSEPTERCNFDGNSVFYAGTPGSNFDDLLLYYDRNNLVSLFGTAGCPNAW